MRRAGGAGRWVVRDMHDILCLSGHRVWRCGEVSILYTILLLYKIYGAPWMRVTDALEKAIPACVAAAMSASRDSRTPAHA